MRAAGLWQFALFGRCAVPPRPNSEPRITWRGLGSARVPGKAALRPPRGSRTRREGRRHRRGRRRGGGGDRLPVRDQGAGADRRARQGRGHQGRRGSRRGPEHADAILGMDISGPRGEGPFTVHQVWVEGASEIESEYYASIILDRSAKKLLAMLSTMGGMNVEEIAEKDPDALARQHIEPNQGFGEPRGRQARRRRRHRRGGAREDGGAAGEALRRLQRERRDPDRGQPAGRDQGRRRGRTRRQGDDRQLRALPPRGPGRDGGELHRGRPGADGQGEGPHLREARRRHRHPRQRRRALHVDPRRGRAGRRQARQLPRRRRRLQGRGDRRRAHRDHLR